MSKQQNQSSVSARSSSIHNYTTTTMGSSDIGSDYWVTRNTQWKRRSAGYGGQAQQIDVLCCSHFDYHSTRSGQDFYERSCPSSRNAVVNHFRPRFKIYFIILENPL